MVVMAAQTNSEVTTAQTRAISQLIITIATDPSTKLIFDMPDASGATPLLAIAVANTTEALDLMYSLCFARIDLLCQTHHPGPFIGENTMHILATNRREEVLCSLIKLAHDHLDSPDLRELFTVQAVGGFFHAEPMASYGSTPVAYMCTFGLRRAIALLLSLAHKKKSKLYGTIDFNSPRYACQRTGYLPIHAVVANRSIFMYDFLTTLPGLPMLAECRAAPEALTREGLLVQFSPLQLACHLGDHEVFKHLLSTRSSIVWKWGPLTQFKLDLHGIDSVGGGANDVMEVVGRVDATHATQEMLLDSCVEGFLHKVFEQKWARFGRLLHGILRTFEALYLTALLAMTVWLKEAPASFLSDGRWLCVCVLVLACPMVEEELRSVFLYWCKLRTNILDPEPEPAHSHAMLVLDDGAPASPTSPGSSQHGAQFGSQVSAGGSSNGGSREGGDSFASRSSPSLRKSGRAHGSVRGDLANVCKWALSQQIAGKFLGCALGLTAASSILAGYVPYGADAGSLGAAPPLAGEDSFGLPIWSILAIALLLGFHTFFASLLLPMQFLGVFFRTSFKIVSRDVSVFVVLSLILFFTYGFTTYVAYPRIGAHELPYFPNYNGLLSAMHELIELAILGEPSTYQLPGGLVTDSNQLLDVVRRGVAGQPLAPYGPLAPQEWFQMAVFTLLYVTYALLSCVLLLNLLIAMMNHTFITAQEEAVLEWRVLYARNVLKLEMLAEAFARFGWLDTHGGEAGQDGKYYAYNRVHNIHAYSEAGDEAVEVGYFGARDADDKDAHLAYAAALGIMPKVLDSAASRVQNIYKARRRRYGDWKKDSEATSPTRSPILKPLPPAEESPYPRRVETGLQRPKANLDALEC